MTATALLDTLWTKGARLSVDGDRVAVDAPKGVLTDVVRQAIRTHKAVLLDLVEAFEERAAILEYDGRVSRAEAERLAWGCVLGEASYGSHQRRQA